MISIDLLSCCSHLRKTISCLSGTVLQLTSTAVRAIVARPKTPSLSETNIFLYGNPKTYNTSLDGTGKCWSSMWSVCQEDLGMNQKSGPNVSNVRVKPLKKMSLKKKNPKLFSGELFGTPGKARRRDLAVEREFWIQDKDQLHMRTIWKLPQVKDKDKYKDKDKD